MMCGPWFWACLPITVGAGAAAGGGVGATAGFIGLSEETAKNLNDVLLELDDQREFRQELFDTIITSVPENDLEARISADVLATLSINRIQVRQHFRGRISIGMSAKVELMQLQPGDILYYRLDSHISRNHECSTRKRDVEEWLKDDQDSIDKALTDCINTISDSITKTLMEVLHGKSWHG